MTIRLNELLKLTQDKEQNPSWEENCHRASQEIPCHLLNRIFTTARLRGLF